jgi:carbamoyl-phosphate synthase large subunit
MNVLVTSCGAKVRLVRAFQAALRVMGGGKVFACDISAESAALFAADRGVLFPETASPEFAGALERFCADNQVQLIIPTRDGELKVLSALSGRLAKVGAFVHAPSSTTLDLCLDKRQFNRYCEAHGFPVARSFGEGREPIFPAFIRPISGAGSVGAQRIDTEDEWRASVRDRDDLVIQAFIDAPAYTVDALLDFDSRPLQAVTRRRMAVTAGESSIGRAEYWQDLEELALRLCAEIGCIGHNVVQAFRSSAGEIHLIEINPRFGGGSSLSLASGLDSPKRLLQLVAGDIEAASAPRPIRYGLTLLRYADDRFVTSKELSEIERMGP